MRRKKKQSISKGAPSGFVVSLLVHAAAFLLAGMLVVFNVVKKEEKKFVPPKAVERPKMNLKKPKVKVKKTSKPKATTRIVTKVKRASMPDIQLPEMSGMSDGLAGGIGGFEIMPDLTEVTMFGAGQTIGNDFVGTFYDMKRDRRGSAIPHSQEQFKEDVKDFMLKGWKPSVWARFYRSPRTLYATTFAIPPVPSSLAPEAFGEPDTIGYVWITHYKGQLVYPEDITFRFWGQGDDLIAVRVDGEIKLISAWTSSSGGESHADVFYPVWRSKFPSISEKYPIGNNMAVVGDWITLKAGEPMDMEVLISEITGGVFCSLLLVEVQGEEYPKNYFRGGPKLPIFKTEEPTLDLAEAIWANLHAGDASVTNGPVFRDFVSKGSTGLGPAPEPVVVEEVEEDPMRVWTLTSGKTVEAEFITVIGGQVALKMPKGRQQKIPLAALSDADLEYIDFATPPEFSIDFSKKSSQLPRPEESPYIWGDLRPLQIFGYTFGVKLKQKSAGAYNHELTVEYFAIGEEVDGDNWVLLDRRSDVFMPTKENKGRHELYGDEVRLQVQALRASAPMRGTKYGGFVITITDERGKIIQHAASHDFLYEGFENLKRLPVGKHFDKDGLRVCPPRPTEGDRQEWM
ncbi:SHD1 domain-containing protein [Pontiella sulfatireligans]|uniref:SLA1 homology domain-containing protein n=1 Tax=Pontiella sulfatireligans TaxID=2750658 RepID=A0A6C2UK45_9BACT|nr:SHD1 domain-containing protein [Pontiella sulfatireligans]VGO19797.1 hypothetical protein SCARR_01857 [Pontiella sulfatireligans]